MQQHNNCLTSVSFSGTSEASSQASRQTRTPSRGSCWTDSSNSPPHSVPASPLPYTVQPSSTATRSRTGTLTSCRPTRAEWRWLRNQVGAQLSGCSTCSENPLSGLDGSDYISATWQPGYHSLQEFIVTQHPLELTIPDFWQMVWEHGVTTIALLSSIKPVREHTSWITIQMYP